MWSGELEPGAGMSTDVVQAHDPVNEANSIINTTDVGTTSSERTPVHSVEGIDARIAHLPLAMSPTGVSSGFSR